MKTLIVKLDGNYVTDIKALNFPNLFTITDRDEDVTVIINASHGFTSSAYYEEYEDEEGNILDGVDYYVFINPDYKGFFEVIDRIHVEDLRRACNRYDITLLTDGTKRIEL